MKTKNMSEITNIIGRDRAMAEKRPNGPYGFFIRKGTIGTSYIFKLKCMCGTTNNWGPPHDEGQLECSKCNALFWLNEVAGTTTHVQTGAGPIPILGSEH